MKYSVDVVLPVFNGEKTIQRAINSILGQSKVIIHKIIVIDDGSTDQTYLIVKSMNLSNIHLVKTINKGVSSARNYGLTFVSSEWVAFLDCDDIWHPQKIFKQISLGVEKNLDFICCANNTLNKFYSKKITIYSLVYGNFISTSSVILRVNRLSSLIPLFDDDRKFAEDYAAWIKLLYNIDGYFISEKLVEYTLTDIPNYRLTETLFGLITLYPLSYNIAKKIDCNIMQKIVSFIFLSIGIFRSIFSSILRYIR